MTNLRPIGFIAVFCLIGTIFVCVIQANVSRQTGSDADLKLNNIEYSQEMFVRGLTSASFESAKVEKKIIKGAVIPHHELANFMVSGLLVNLQRQGPKTIILIGPNHYEAGISKIITGKNAWDTSYGVVYSDKRVFDKLSTNGDVSVDDGILTNDHSITSIIPFIKYYLPDSLVNAFLLSGRMDIADVNKFVEDLSQIIDADTVVIASVDFSHYLSEPDSVTKDAETIETIKKKNVTTLLKYNNDYLDSSASVSVLMKLMEKIGADLEVVDNTNSGILTKDTTSPVTSYFFLVY
jgi:AmmeMemoRadiSam system protein B